MLLTELILSKRGPLGKVWLSAHQERKLSKQQTLNIDVEESVEAILGQEEGPTTLRISGQLMLGVTRIYSRKVQYLLDDCKDTRERIALAFRPGIVDLPEDQAKASKNAITFSDVRNDFDFLDWSWNAPPLPETNTTSGAHTASAAQINLRPVNKEFGAYNFGRPAASSIYGGSSVSRHPSQDDSSSHLDSQDFSGIDLQLNLDMENDQDVDMELDVEQGRHVMRGSSVGSARTGIRASTLDKDDPIRGEENAFEPVDLNLNFDDFVDLPGDEARQRQASVASSALSPPPELSETTLTDITPRTAARIAQLQPNNTSAAVDNADRRAKRIRLLRADADIELDDAYFAHPAPDAPVWGQQRFIPSDPSAVAMRELLSDPGNYFLPLIDVGNDKMIYAGPQGLAPELEALFAFPTNVLRRNREEDAAAAGPAAKRARIGSAGVEGEQDEDEAVEAARRQSIVPFDHQNEGGFDLPGVGEDSFSFPNPAAGDPDLFDEPLIDPLSTPRRTAMAREREREPSLAPSRAESVARQIQFGERGDFPLAMFDPRTQAGVESQIQSQSTPTKSSVAASEARTQGGYSKNTGMAMGMLRRELEAIEEAGAEAEEEKVVRMSEVSDKASKQAAATFFFELLVLGTRDCVKLDQQEAFGDIEIRGKERLWQEISA